MAKRFTDTDKWKDDWFLELTPSLKLFWIYLLDNCDHAGVWKVNLKLASFCIADTFLDKQSILNAFGNRILVISDTKWHIPKFITHQYGKTLNLRNNAHRGALKALEFNNLSTRPYLVVGSTSHDSLGDKDKEQEQDQDQDQDQDKDQDKDKEKEEAKKNLPSKQPQDFRNSKEPKFTPDHVVDIWNAGLGKANGMSPGLGGGKHLSNCLEAIVYLPDAPAWNGLFDRVSKSEFLMGQTESKRTWKAPLVWLVNYDNALRVLAGEFDNGADHDDLYSKIKEQTA